MLEISRVLCFCIKISPAVRAPIGTQYGKCFNFFKICDFKPLWTKVQSILKWFVGSNGSLGKFINCWYWSLASSFKSKFMSNGWSVQEKFIWFRGDVNLGVQANCSKNSKCKFVQNLALELNSELVSRFSF